MTSSFLPPHFPRLKVVWLVKEVVSRGTEGTNRSGHTRPATVQILATCRMKRSHERLWDHVTRSKWGPDHAASALYSVHASRVSLLQFIWWEQSGEQSPLLSFLCFCNPTGGTDLTVSWAEPADLLFWLRCLDHHKTVSHFQPMLPMQLQVRMGIARDKEGKLRNGRV